MFKTGTKSIVVDAREFVRGKSSGIGRVLEGLVDALAESDIVGEIILPINFCDAIPLIFKNREKIRILETPHSFLQSEKFLTDLTRNGACAFVSPYPKLPLFGCHCKAIHTVHDVLDLTHPAYKKRYKAFFDGFRLKRALKKAALTWYDSSWSLQETKKYAGSIGKNPRVRFPGVDKSFNTEKQNNEPNVLKQYELSSQYILVLGNGSPHKNLGCVLEISDQISKDFVFAGVSQKNQGYWKSRYPRSTAKWIDHVLEEDLPAIIRGAFCLAQPSTAEGYGYPPLEAMSCGVPVVVSNIPVLVETTGGNALKADPNDSIEWLQAFEALEKKDIYQNQLQKGLRWIQPLWGRGGWESHVLDLEELVRGSKK